MNEKRSLLLPSSLIFEGSSLADNIHQTYIDLETIINDDEKDQKEIEHNIPTFLREALKYLEKDLPYNVLTELFSSILLCFTYFIEISIPFFNDFYEKSKFNSNFIIITSSILYQLTSSGVTFEDTKYNFITDTLKEILTQIQNKSQIWTVYNHQIMPQFQDDLLINLLLSLDITKEIFFDYFRFVLSRNIFSTNQKYDLLVQILSESDFTAINSMTETANDEICNFLINQNFELISSMSFESFSLVYAAVILIENQGEPILDGLTEDSILQYISIVAVIQKKMGNEINIESSEISELICSKIESLKSNEHPVFKESLKIIIDSQINSHKYKLKFSIKNSFKIMITIIKKFFDDDKFLTEKGQIFKYIFFLTTISGNPMIQHFLQKNDIFHFIMTHLNEVNSYSIFNFPKFNLNSVKPSTIIEYLNSLQNSEEIIQCLSFITDFCDNVPKMVPSNVLNEKLLKIFNEKVKENQLKDALLIGQFLQNHFYFEMVGLSMPKHLQYLLYNDIPSDNDELNEIIEFILLAPNPEEFDEYFYLLTLKMLENKEILQQYLIHLITVNSNLDYDIDSFLTRALKQFNLYKDDFLKAIRGYFYFNGQILLKKIDFSLSSLPVPEFGLKIVSKLYESIEKKPENYQAFICLKNIACTFPFLFSHNFEKDFYFVIKSFNYISLLFENKPVKNQTELIKTSLSAISFLFSFFQAPYSLDKLMDLLFKNILTFTNEQVACFMIYLRSFYSDGLFHCVILAYFLKYDFMNTVGKLLERDISNESFRNFYRCSIYDFLDISFYELSKLRHYEIVQIKEFEKIESPFNFFYDYIYLTSPCLIQLNEEDIINAFTKIDTFQPFASFINTIDKLKSFWLFNYGYEYTFRDANQSQIKDFIQELRKFEMTEIDEDSITQTFPKLTIKMVRYLVMNRGFIYCWYLYSLKHSLVKPLFDELTKTADVLKTMKKDAKEHPEDEDNKDILTVDIDSYMMNCYSHENLYQNLVKQLAESNEILFSSISEAIQKICLKKSGISMFLHSLSQFIADIFGNDSIFTVNKMYRIIDLLIILSKNENFVEFFINSKCCDNLIDVVLSPQMRTDPKILTKTVDIFVNFDKNIPIRVTHLIGFIFMNEYEGLVQSALILCSKFDQNQLNHLNKMIVKEFDKELVKGKITENLFYFLKYYKKAAEGRKSKIIELLNNQLENYDDQNAFQNIGVLLTALAPMRGKIENTKNVVSKRSRIPLYIRETSIEFWNMYEQYESFVMEEIQKDPMLLLDFSFLLDFPEIVSFKIRSSFFRKKMKMRIDNDNFTYLMIDRDNILKTSFTEIQNSTLDELLNTIQIQFIDEPVQDLGGGRREWFELLIKELFKKENNLFECSKKSKSYQPSHLSSANPNHIDYFTFAGKIIARILIEGQCIDAHLTKSFYKQILHIDPNFEDLEDFDSELYQGLEWMLHNDVNSLDKVFAIDVDSFDKVETIPLKENGENIEVTNDNKKEYINLHLDFVLKKQIKDQLNAFINGFNSLIHPDEIKFFNQDELDLLLCGIPKIDVDDFRANTVFDHPYTADSPVVKLFFKVISKWDNDDLAKLLMFMTGSSRVPANGFKEFCEMTHFPLKIDSGGDRSLLPQSHTCFNILHLPQYETEEEMNEKLHQAIQHCDTFGLI